METILIDEKFACNKYAKEAFRLRKEGDIYKNSLEIDPDNYIHEMGNVFWMVDTDLDTNISYLLKLCRNNYMRGLSALSLQLKAERERNMLRLFIEKAGLKEAFLLFEKQVNNFLIPN